MGATQNCCQKREDEVEGIANLGSLKRKRRQGRADDDNESGWETNVDIAALIREDHELKYKN